MAQTSDLPPGMSPRGMSGEQLASLVARVSADTTPIKKQMEEARQIVEQAAKDMTKAGSVAGAEFGDAFTEAFHGGFGEGITDTFRWHMDEVEAQLQAHRQRMEAHSNWAADFTAGWKSMMADVPWDIDPTSEGQFPLFYQQLQQPFELEVDASAVRQELEHEIPAATRAALEQEFSAAMDFLLSEGERASAQFALNWERMMADVPWDVDPLPSGQMPLRYEPLQIPIDFDVDPHGKLEELEHVVPARIRDAFDQNLTDLASTVFQPDAFAADFDQHFNIGSMLKDAFKGAQPEIEEQGREGAQNFSKGFDRGVEMFMPRSMRLLVHGHIAGALLQLGATAARAGRDLIELGGQMEGIALGFETLSDAPGQLMSKMRTASRGTINEMQLMQSANRAMVMGIVEDEATLIRLLEVSYVMARTRGIEVGGYFDRMTNALASLHPTTLRSLGIMINTRQANEEYAKSIGKTVQQLTDQERRLIMVNAIFNNEHIQSVKAAVYEQDLLADALGRVTAELGNIRIYSADVVAETERQTGAVGALGRAFGDVADWMRGHQEQGQQYRELQRLLIEAEERGLDIYREAAWEKNRLWHAEATLNIGREEASEKLEKLIALLREEIDASRDSEEVLFAWAAANYGAEIAVDRHAASLSRLINLLGDTRLGLDPGLAFRAKYGLGPQPEDPIAKDVKALQDWNKMLGARQDYHRALMTDSQLLTTLRQDLAQYNEYQEEYWRILVRINSVEERMAKNREKASTQRVEQMSAEERAMRSLVRSQISLTQVTWEDMLATQMGVYQDKPDEYIRRLRSAVTDEQTLWRDLLDGREGAEAELYLMQQERAFKSGMWGELGPHFDRADAIERIVGQVQHELEAQRQMEALINEIMMHPALMGVGRRTVEQVMGVPEDHRATGVDTVKAFASGLEMGIPLAVTELHNSFEEEFRAQEERWFIMGELSVTWFAEGIKRGDHTKAVNILVDMIAPRVADRLQGRP